MSVAELQDRFKHWDEREGLITVGRLTMRDATRALVRSLPTMHHALELFDAVVQLVGDRGWLDPEGGEQRRRLLVRDPEHPDWLVPGPLLEHCWSGVRGELRGPSFINPNAVRPADAPDGWKPGDPWYGEQDPEPALYPRGPDMRAGDIQIAAGPLTLRVKFDERGLELESVTSSTDPFSWARYHAVKPFVVDPLARPPTQPPLPILSRDDLDPAGHDPATLAQMVADLRPEDRVAARVYLPLPIPGGADGASTRALWAMREACWSGDVPGDARWLAADGFDGSALAWGSSREEVLARLEEEIARVRPKPPGWKPEPEPEAPELEPESPRRIEDTDGKLVGVSTGTLHLVAPAVGELAWPMPLPRLTPRVVLPLPPEPGAPPAHLAAAGFERWVRLIGPHGCVEYALLRDDGGDGHTLIGAGVLDLVDDVAALDRELDESDALQRAHALEMAEHGLPNPWQDPEYRCREATCTIWDDGHRRRVPAKQVGARWTVEPTTRDRGAELAWRVSRRRWEQALTSGPG